jgi:hypothetical protein
VPAQKQKVNKTNCNMKTTTAASAQQTEETIPPNAGNLDLTGQPTARSVKPVRPPGWRQFDRVQAILEDDLALRRCLGERTHEVEKSNGKKVRYSAEAVMVAQAFFDEHMDAAKTPKRDIVGKAGKLLLCRANATTPSQPGVAQAPASCPVTTDAKQDGVPSISENGDEVITQAPKLVPVKVVSPEVVKVKNTDDDEPATPLSKREQQELQQHEKTIKKGWAMVVESRLALLAIPKRKALSGRVQDFRAILPAAMGIGPEHGLPAH